MKRRLKTRLDHIFDRYSNIIDLMKTLQKRDLAPFETLAAIEMTSANFEPHIRRNLENIEKNFGLNLTIDEQSAENLEKIEKLWWQIFGRLHRQTWNAVFLSMNKF